jgi:thioredoxin-dependent peroxiredoxin
MLSKNQIAPEIVAESVTGEHIDLYGLKGKKVLVKFHRFSGCPVCQYQVNELIGRQDQLNEAGIETIVFIHSSKEKILPVYKEVPGLHIIADKQKAFYKIYHSGFRWQKIFSFASWRVIFEAFFHGFFPKFDKFDGSVTGIPSDFLLDEKSIIIDLHYGTNFGDTWSVADVLSRLHRPS